MFCREPCVSPRSPMSAGSRRWVLASGAGARLWFGRTSAGTCSQRLVECAALVTDDLGVCDALFTDQCHVALGIKVADCLPVSLCDPVHRVIANIHSGWRGAAQNITAETLDTLARETAFDPGTAYAYLGPSIRVCCFEVGEEVAAQFDQRWIDRARGAKPHVDLARMTEAILRRRGVAQVIDTGLCTRCNPMFHSYRRDKKSGRNLAIAAQ